MHIFLDESGDLGFDFNDKKPSRYFVITLLVCDNQETVTIIKKAIERTLKNKIAGHKELGNQQELKGSSIPFNIKAYFYKNISRADSWKIYSIILDKKTAFKKLTLPIDTHRLYNILANHLLKQVDFARAKTVNLLIDKSKNRDGINAFDDMLKLSLNVILPLNVPLNISHIPSHKSYGIQAVDLFCWGLFRKYMHADEEWYYLFKDKIAYEKNFLV